MEDTDLFVIRVTRYDNKKIRYDMMRGQVWQKEMTKSEVINLVMEMASALRFE